MNSPQVRSWTSRPGVWLGLGILLYSLFYFGFDFQCKVVRTDDFAYMRSVLGTLVRGKLYTYEYLAPYSATMSAFGALAFQLTGNFPISTWGLIAACSILSFVLLRWILVQSLVPGQATFLAFLFMTLPILQVKSSDFHGCVVNLALFLLALLLFEKKHFFWFFCASFCAFANRQNHFVLLILPLINFFQENPFSMVSRTRLANLIFLWRIPIYSCLYLAAALTLHFQMNTTYAQKHALTIAFEFMPRVQAFLEAAVAGTFVSLGSLAIFGLLFRSPIELAKENIRKWKLPAGLSLLLILFAVFLWRPNLICHDTTLFGLLRFHTLNQFLPWIILCLLWFLDYRALKPTPYLILACGFILSVSPRGIWWDYYFVEILVLCLILSLRYYAAKFQVKSFFYVPRVQVILGLVLLINLVYGYLLRISADRDQLYVSAYERLERAKAISPLAMSTAPYGYLGWKLFDSYFAHQGNTFESLSGFLNDVAPNAVRIETHLPWRRHFSHRITESDSIAEQGFWRIGFLNLQYRRVHRRDPSQSFVQNRNVAEAAGADSIGRNLFPTQIFPMTNAEWRDFIKAEKIRFAND